MGSVFAAGDLQRFEYPVFSDIERDSEGTPLSGGTYNLDVKFRSEYTSVSRDPKGPYLNGFGEFRGSIFMSQWLSFHGRAQVEYSKLSQFEWDLKRETNLFVVQVGNLGRFPFRLVVGRSRSPFGLNEPVLKGWYQKQFKDDLYQSPYNTTYFSWDNKVNFILDFGISMEKISKFKSGETVETKNDMGRAFSLRFIYDFPILGSARTIFSVYAHENGQRRGSFGLLMIGDKAEETNFDIVRERSTPDGKQGDFKQRIRIAYKGPLQGGSRWSFELNDEINHITVAGLYYEINLVKYLWYTQGFGYRRMPDNSKDKGGILLFGLGSLL